MAYQVAVAESTGLVTTLAPSSTSIADKAAAEPTGAGAAAAVADTKADGDSPQRTAAEASLWRWNAAMAFLHGTQAVIVLAAALSTDRLKAFKIPMVTTFTDWSRGYPVAAIQHRADMPFVAVTSGFAFLSCFAHLVVLACFQQYKADLRRGRNLFRWYEYAASSSLMIALIAQLFGVYDILLLVALMSVNACMNLFGLLHETMNEGREPARVDFTSFWFGCFAGAVPWAVIFSYLAGNSGAGNIPGFVWALLVIYALFFNTFPINMYLQYRQWHWFSDAYHGWAGGGYLFGERMYQIQSLVSKSFLLWLVVGGSNQPSSFTGNTRA